MASMLRHFAIVTVPAIFPGATRRAVAVAPAVAAAFVPVTVAIDLSHHRRRAGLEFLDPHRNGAQHIFPDVLLPLDLGDRRSRRIHVEEGEMRLAVLTDAIGKGFDAPILHLRDAAAHLLDDALKMGRNFIDLLLRQILPRQKNMLIQWHVNTSPRSALIRRQALRAFPERLESSKAGTRDVGPYGPAVSFRTKGHA